MTKYIHLHHQLFLICLFVLLNIPRTFGQISKNTHQTIITDNIESVRINIKDATVEIKETKGSRILVETNIVLSVPNEALLNFVIENGRYELVQIINATTRQLTIESKKDKNIIVVKGEACAERISYIIYVPTTMRVFKD